jgi:Tfp pilus assembly protein PilV
MRRSSSVPQKVKNTAGFGLVDGLVTTLVLSIAVIGLLTSFVMGRTHSYHSRHRSQAMNLLQERIEELKARGYDYLNWLSPNPAIETGLALDAGPDEESPTDDLLCTRTSYISDQDGDGALEVLVSLTWTERVAGGNEVFTESLFTVVSQSRVMER